MGIIDGGDGRGHSLIGALRARRRSAARPKGAPVKKKGAPDAPADDAPRPVTDEGGPPTTSATADAAPSPTIPPAAVAAAAPPPPPAPPAAVTRAAPRTRAMRPYPAGGVGQVEDRELSSVSSPSPPVALRSSAPSTATGEAVHLASLAVVADGQAVAARTTDGALAHARDAYMCTFVAGLWRAGWRGTAAGRAGPCGSLRERVSVAHEAGRQEGPLADPTTRSSPGCPHVVPLVLLWFSPPPPQGTSAPSIASSTRSRGSASAPTARRSSARRETTSTAPKLSTTG